MVLLTTLGRDVSLTSKNMKRTEKRRIDRARQKVAKRGPHTGDFTVRFSSPDNVPYITFTDMKNILPTPLYKSMIDLEKVEPHPEVLQDENREKGLFVGDCDIVFSNAREYYRKQKLSTG